MNTVAEGIFKNTKGARMMQGEKLTNFERIKSMTVDEMAEFIENKDSLFAYCKQEYCEALESNGRCKMSSASCLKAAKKWLESEVEDETREETDGEPEKDN